MHDYHNLLVWKRSFIFVQLTYRLTRKLFPRDEMFGLASQFRRASISIVANIVEGRGKHTDRDFLRYLYIAKGSLNECQCYLEISQALLYINHVQSNFMLVKLNEVAFLLNKLIVTIELSQPTKHS